MPREQVDVLIVTALQLERRAVREHLVEVRVERMTGLSADIGRTSDERLRVAVIETGAGNVDAAILTARAEDGLRPSVLVMMGIAGGLKDVTVGDVVASSKVYWVEAGKQEAVLQTRPDFAPVSPELVQIARAVVADDSWLSRARGAAGPWPTAGRSPIALVAPIAVGEKVLADRRSVAAETIRAAFGDAVAVDMEDFGALRAGRSAERARVIAVRGISDLVDDKASSDAGGSQPLAAANAAAFVFEMLSRLPLVAHPMELDDRIDTLAEVGRELYPEGPQQDGLWERAGGDPSRLLASGSGASRWWHAATLLRRGGGGRGIAPESLIATMTGDYPQNAALQRMGT